MYKKYYIPILFLVIAIGLVSCKNRDQWKLPTNMNTIIHYQNNRTSNNIVFTTGYINLAEFSFNGEREQGENVYFTKPFSGGLVIPFSEIPVSNLNFDIPQGTYDKIQISFNTFEALRLRSDSNETGDMTSINSIEINGIFTDQSGDSYTVKFELNSQEYFSVITQSEDGNNKIILNKDIPVTTYITFNPEFWFRTISSEMLENATKVMDDENSRTHTILINEDTNVSLYDIIVNRIGKELKIVIKAR